jgi:phosphate uptake regulator
MVFEHMALNPSGDLTPALILTSTIIDVERIGDYAKNLFEQAELYGRPFPDAPHFNEVSAIVEDVMALFEIVGNALREGDIAQAREVMDRHQEIGRRCEDEIGRIADNDGIATRDAVILALSCRFLKRISAHLSNLASSVVNPFDRIGFQPGNGSAVEDAD